MSAEYNSGAHCIFFSFTLSTSTAHSSFFFSFAFHTKCCPFLCFFPYLRDCPSIISLFLFLFSIFPSLSYLSYVQGSFLCVGKKRHLTGCYVVCYPCLPLSQREKKYGKNRGREGEGEKTLRFGTLVFDVCFISTPIGCGFASAHGSPRFRRYY